MMPQKRTIVDQLRKAIEEGGSEYAISQATGVDTGILSRFVRGKRGISLETAAKLCEHFDLALIPRRRKQ
jgi:plasmid maintenance system antidote protein VapI